MNKYTIQRQDFVWTPNLKDLQLFWLDISTLTDSFLQQSVLSTEEKISAARYLPPERKKLAVLSRTVLRLVLSLYLEKAPQKIEIVKNEYKKPMLPDAYALHFNVSHTSQHLLIGISRNTPIGVDIESMNSATDWQKIAKRYFTAIEKEQIQVSENQSLMFYQIWTAKEAFIKGYGSGFHFPVDRFNICYTQPMQAWVESELPLSPDSWQVRNFLPAPECMGAIAAPQELDQIQATQLDDTALNKIAASWNIL